MRRPIAVAAMLAVALPLAARAHESRIRAEDLPPCSTGRPFSVWLLNSSDENTCSKTSTGSAEAHCCCSGGAWAACGGDADGGQFLKLAGRAGGQTAIGGTAAGDDLVLQSSSGGTNPPVLVLDDSAELFDFNVGFSNLGEWSFDELNVRTPLIVADVYGSESTDGCATITGNTVDADTAQIEVCASPAGITLDPNLSSTEELVFGAGTGFTITLPNNRHFLVQNDLADGIFIVEEDTGDIAAERCVGIGDAASPTGRACICRSSGDDRLFHDTDCDATKDLGEEWIDNASGSVSDGDKGDITVSGSGATWTVDSGAVGLGEIADDAGCAANDLAVRNSSDTAFDCFRSRETLYIAATEMSLASGSATITVRAGNLPVWTLADAASNKLCGYVAIPQKLRGKNFDVHLLHAPDSTSTCNYRLTVETKAFADGTSIATAGTTTTPASIASSGTIDILDVADSTANLNTSSTTVGAAVCTTRIGAHANDTCTNNLYLVAIQLEEQ